MRRFYIVLTLFFVTTLFACVTGNSVKRQPAYITSGIEQMEKGVTWYQKGRYERSLEHFFRAHELFVVSDYLSGVAMSMNNIGNAYRMLGDTTSAILFLEESFSIYTYIEDHKGAVRALSNKAAALIDGNMLEEATSVLNTAEDIAQKIRKPFIPLLSNRGVLLIRKKEYEDAENVLKRALAKVDPKNLSEFATVNSVLGNLMLETERYEEAIDYFKTALAADRSLGFHKGIAGNLASIGSVYFIQGRDELAVNFLERSIKVYALIGNEERVRKIMKQLEKASERSNLDISVTKHFVKRWLTVHGN